MARWCRCSKLLTTEASWRNACSIILRFKPLSTTATMNRHILRSRMKSRKTNPRLRIDKKEATTFARGALNKRRSSTSLRRIKFSPRRSRVTRTTRFTGTSVLSSKAHRSRSCLQSPSNSGTLNLTRRQLRVS